MNAAERLMEYVKYETTSDENSGKHPSSDGQLVFAEHLAEEMRRIGIRDVRLNRYGCLFGSIPATPGLDHLAPVGLLAHMDTSSEASGNNVNAQIIRSYNGGILPLGSSGKQLDPEHFPSLNHLIGHTLITTDGTTLLGADDKAGIAEIMTAAERILSSETPHRKICIGFTPDEEIGEGTDFFDVSDFGAAYAYTVDGGGGGEIEYQNFNAASAQVRISSTPSFLPTSRRRRPPVLKASITSSTWRGQPDPLRCPTSCATMMRPVLRRRSSGCAKVRIS